MSLINSTVVDFNLIEQQFQRDRAIQGDNPFREFPQNCIVIGIGGIGGHVAEILSSISNVGNIVLFDSDIVEINNLNRTVFSYPHVGAYKVEAMQQIITTRNVSPNIIPINRQFNEETCNLICDDTELDFIRFNSSFVFDCRDNFYGDYGLFEKIAANDQVKYKILRAAYNGLSITIDMNPESHPVWGGGGYNQETGSHSVPSRLAALLVVICAAKYNYLKGTPLFNIPLTFDAQKIIDFIFKGISIDQLGQSEKDSVLHTLEKNINKDKK